MRRSKAEIYLHLVWATRAREPALVGTVNETARRVIREEAQALGCAVVALGGMPDHLHLLARVSARVSASELAKQVKGASSRTINELLPDYESFRWQEGYGVFSVSRSHVARVAEYIEHQAERHAQQRLWPEWEETDEETPDAFAAAD
jgi:putative transposase